MKFFYAPNTTVNGLKSGVNPWDFKTTENITNEIRMDKGFRQAWYKNPNTSHFFYTGIEPMNSTSRVSKENQPLYIHAFVADYDIRLSEDRVKEAIKTMRFKPTYVETSLGGNRRLIWLLKRSILVQDAQFCRFVLQRSIKWLSLGLLPDLDEPAYTTATRLYCLGDVWTPTGYEAIDENPIQAFLVDCLKDYEFKPETQAQIPLDAIEKALKEKFPSFNWPGDFVVGSQGPTFWVPESVSPLSAIVKEEGMISFAAHAKKTFTQWGDSDLLGAEFVRNFKENSIAEATKDVYWNGHKYYIKKRGRWESCAEPEMNDYLAVSARLSSKPDKTGVSPLQDARHFIKKCNSVRGAGPFCFRPEGLIHWNGDTYLNTYTAKCIQPSETKGIWGPEGNMPFLYGCLSHLFDPFEEQIPHFLAWTKHFYECAYNQEPSPGHILFLMGAPGSGKTFVMRNVIGPLVGGFADAASYIMDNSPFNAHLYEKGLWVIDDDTPGSNQQAQAMIQARFKKLAANQEFMSNQKFEKASMVEWMGRAAVTANLDFVSTQIFSMDNNSADKISLFRCIDDTKPRFAFHARRKDNITAVEAELPLFANFLLNYEIDRKVVPVCPMNRYGSKSYHHPALLKQTQQSSVLSPFKELIIKTLGVYFQTNPDQTEWTGSCTTLLETICMYSTLDSAKRMTPTQAHRNLENLQREGQMKCSWSDGPHLTRLWTFSRSDFVTDDALQARCSAVPQSVPDYPNPFQKPQ